MAGLAKPIPSATPNTTAAIFFTVMPLSVVRPLADVPSRQSKHGVAFRRNSGDVDLPRRFAMFPDSDHNWRSALGEHIQGSVQRQNRASSSSPSASTIFENNRALSRRLTGSCVLIDPFEQIARTATGA
jgi:hypothetical protein